MLGEEVMVRLGSMASGSRDATGDGGDACWVVRGGSIGVVSVGRRGRVADVDGIGWIEASEGAFEIPERVRETSEGAFWRPGRVMVGEGGVGGFVRTLRAFGSPSEGSSLASLRLGPDLGEEATVDALSSATTCATASLDPSPAAPAGLVSC